MRVKVAEVIQQNKPGMVKFRMLNNADKEVLEAGNRNHVLSSTILHKISSENRAANDLNKDLISYVQKLYEKFKISWPHHKYPGYIQNISSKPFYMIFYTVRQIEHLISQKDTVFLN